MAAPVNLSFETSSAPGVPQGWAFAYVATGRTRANFAVKGLSLGSRGVSAGAYELPAWLTIRCPTTQRSAQVSASEAVSGFAADTARRFSRDGVAFGILIEKPATNIIDDQRFDAGWTLTQAAVTNDTAPDGTAGIPIRVEDTNASLIGSISKSYTVTTGVDWSQSIWMKNEATVGGSDQTAARHLGGFVLMTMGIGVQDSTWALFNNTTAPVTATALAACYPRLTAAGVGHGSFWGFQVEIGSYPTSFMGADDATFTRAADVLYVNDPSLMIWGDGYAALTLDVQMLFANTEPDGDFFVMWIDANNHVMWNDATGEFEMTIEGVALASGVSTTWARDAVLTFTITNTPLTSSLAVTGGTTSSESSVGTFPTTSPIYLLGDSTGATEAFALQDFTWVAAPNGFEDFEWLPLESSLTASTAALYGSGSLVVPLAFDGFEASLDAWDTAYATTVIGGVDAAYDLGTPATTEDFEEEWNESSGTATTTSSSDEFSDNAHGLEDDMRVRITGSPVPTPFSASVLYWVVDSATNTFGLATTMGGTAITATASETVTWYTGHSGYLTSLSSPTVGDYHPGGGTDETFEAGSGEGWDTSYITALSSPTDASYDSGGTPETVEDFEEVELRQAFAVTVSTNLIQATAHGLSNGDEITLESTGALPGGLLQEITYFVINSNTNDFQVSLTSGGSAASITDSGTGVHRIIQDRARWWTEEYV